MFGKKRYVLLIPILFLFACSHMKNNPTVQNTTTDIQMTDQKSEEVSYQVLSGKNEFKSQDFNEKFHPQWKRQFSSNYPDFIPQVLTNDGELMGEVPNEGLFLLDLKNDREELFYDIKDTPDVSNLWVRAVNEDYVFLEEYSLKKEQSSYRVMNRNTKEVSTITIVEGTPQIHEVQTQFLNTHQLILNYFTKKVDQAFIYQTAIYDTLTGELNVIENQNTTSPVFFKGKLYYILIDNKNHKTSIIEYDLNTMEKRTVLNNPSANNYMTQLITTDDFLYVVLGVVHHGGTIYKVNEEKKTLDWVYGFNSLGQVRVNHQYVTWSTAPENQQRTKTKIHLIDLVSGIDYDYEDSLLFLSDNGIAWVSFVKDMNQIPKGDTFKQGNSEIHYMLW